LTFGVLLTRRIGFVGLRRPPLRPFSGPWGLPPRHRSRPSIQPTDLTPVALTSPSGFHPRLPAAPDSFECHARHASPGVRSPFSTYQARGSTTTGFPHPATFRPQGLNPLDGFLPANPPDHISDRSAHGLLPFRGFLLRVRRYSLRSPSPPRRWPPAFRRLLQRPGPNRRCSTRRPVLGAFRTRNPYPHARCYALREGRFPSWASSSLRLSRRRPDRPDSGDHPPWTS